MKIIVDTNVWYELGADEQLFRKVASDPLAPTFNTLSELTLTGNMVQKEADVQAASRAMLQFEENLIFDPPFVHVAKLTKGYEFDGKAVFAEKLAIASILANGGGVAPEHREAFRASVDHKRNTLQPGTDLFNTEAQRIRSKIAGQVDEHLKAESIQGVLGFVDFCVRVATNQEVNLENVSLENFELLIYTLDAFFKKIEVTQMSFKNNDWYDFSLLAYVQPGDKLWTFERRWINLIEEIGMQHYLYVQP